VTGAAPRADVTGSDAGQRIHVRVHRGLDLPVPGAASGGVESAPAIHGVGVLGADHPGLRLRALVSVGDAVEVGQPLLEDRTRPALRVTSPGAGRVQAIHHGERRTIESVVIALGAGGERRFEVYEPRSLPGLSRPALVEGLCEAGLWCALRARPFGKIPDPEAEPDAIFVTAIDTHALAPPPELAVAEHAEDFALGLVVLARLTAGPVYLCRKRGSTIRAPTLARLVDAEFEGPHPAGLPGTHVHRLHRVAPGRSVWSVAYPDVIAIGKLFTTGRLWLERIVSVAGPGVRRPRFVRARLGASTADLVRGALVDARCRVVSGPLLSGRTAAGHAAFLGLRHLSVSALLEPGQDDRAPWWGVGRAGRARRLLPGAGAAGGWAASAGGQAPGPFLPIPAFDRAFALDLPVGPLLRALVVGDAHAARALGALELVEEDLALCSFLCPSGIDYGALLRRVLDRLEADL
jgi:Na+-transporting NADH:ubiquinone oxidoreductase subunit A